MEEKCFCLDCGAQVGFTKALCTAEHQCMKCHEKRHYSVEIKIKRMGGYSKWERGLPQTKRAAESSRLEHIGLGYVARVVDLKAPVAAKKTKRRA